MIYILLLNYIKADGGPAKGPAQFGWPRRASRKARLAARAMALSVFFGDDELELEDLMDRGHATYRAVVRLP